jgi:dipicolinate synthase subunit B
MQTKTLGFAMCGSFCTLARAMEQMRRLAEAGYRILPIMSEITARTDTRFGRAADFMQEAQEICGQPVLHTIPETEPIGPKRMVDLMVVAPCTGNTLAKLAHGVTDTAVTMAVKSSLRVQLPVLLTLATNDALAASGQNIGRLLNTKNIYFTPFAQDDPLQKPTSLVAKFDLLPEAVAAALEGQQLQPIVQGIAD